MLGGTVWRHRTTGGLQSRERGVQAAGPGQAVLFVAVLHHPDVRPDTDTARADPGPPLFFIVLCCCIGRALPRPAIGPQGPPPPPHSPMGSGQQVKILDALPLPPAAMAAAQSATLAEVNTGRSWPARPCNVPPVACDEEHEPMITR